jgi:hypothetical protein
LSLASSIDEPSACIAITHSWAIPKEAYDVRRGKDLNGNNGSPLYASHSMLCPILETTISSPWLRPSSLKLFCYYWRNFDGSLH